MKCPAPLLTAAALLLTAALPLRADAPPALSLTLAPDGSWDAAWQGEADITYFMQWSPDLVHWQYLPLMKVGAGPHTYGGPANVTKKCFIKLRSTDLDPALDSFDTDTLSNWDEVTQYFRQSTQLHGPAIHASRSSLLQPLQSSGLGAGKRQLAKRPAPQAGQSV